MSYRRYAIQYVNGRRVAGGGSASGGNVITGASGPHVMDGPDHTGTAGEDQLATGTPTPGYAPIATGDGTAAWGQPGVTDHGALSGLGDDDHPQYQTEAEVLALIAANAPSGGEPLTNGNEDEPEIVFVGGDVIMVGSAGGGSSGGSTAELSFVDARDYGVVLDCRGAYDAVVDGGDLSTVTSATAAFTSADTGKTFTLASTAGAVTTGTLTYVSATACTMSVAAGGAMTGARLIFGTDDTDAWQDALDAALPGQTVDASGFSWRSLCAGHLAIPLAVTLGHFGRGPFDPLTNPAMTTWGPTFVIVQDGDSFVTLTHGSGLGDFIFYSANQAPPTAATPIEYGYMIEIPGDSSSGTAGAHIGRPYLANAYNGILVQGGRHIIDAPQIGALSRGLRIDQSQDTVSIGRIQISVYWRICENISSLGAGTFAEYVANQAWAVEINRSDSFMIEQIFCLNIYGALLMTDSPDTGLSNRAGYGMVGMLDADGVARGVYAISANLLQLASANVRANSSGVGAAGDVGIATVAGGTKTPVVVVKSMYVNGTWSTGATSNGAGTLIVPGTNPG